MRRRHKDNASAALAGAASAAVAEVEASLVVPPDPGAAAFFDVDNTMMQGASIYDALMAARIWSGTRALAQLHLDAGQRVWLVTAAPAELASLIARRLGLTGALGTVAENRDGVYTGRLVGEPLHGPAKAEA